MGADDCDTSAWVQDCCAVATALQAVLKPLDAGDQGADPGAATTGRTADELATAGTAGELCDHSEH